jgi:hypothetical protein
MESITNVLLRFASILQFLGMFFVLAECPRIDGGLTILSGLYIFIISMVSGFGIWLMTTTHAKKFRNGAFIVFAPSAAVMFYVADYYSTYLFLASVLVVVIAIYDKILLERLVR